MVQGAARRLRAFRSVIDMALAKHERVEVVNIPGNHDPEATPVLALALGEFYSRNKRVNDRLSV
jgi:hypothetical protein